MKYRNYTSNGRVIVSVILCLCMVITSCIFQVPVKSYAAEEVTVTVITTTADGDNIVPPYQVQCYKSMSSWDLEDRLRNDTAYQSLVSQMGDYHPYGGWISIFPESMTAHDNMESYIDSLAAIGYRMEFDQNTTVYVPFVKYVDSASVSFKKFYCGEQLYYTSIYDYVESISGVKPVDDEPEWWLVDGTDEYGHTLGISSVFEVGNTYRTRLHLTAETYGYDLDLNIDSNTDPDKVWITATNATFERTRDYYDWEFYFLITPEHMRGPWEPHPTDATKQICKCKHCGETIEERSANVKDVTVSVTNGTIANTSGTSKVYTIEQGQQVNSMEMVAPKVGYGNPVITLNGSTVSYKVGQAYTDGTWSILVDADFNVSIENTSGVNDNTAIDISYTKNKYNLTFEYDEDTIDSITVNGTQLSGSTVEIESDEDVEVEIVLEDTALFEDATDEAASQNTGELRDFTVTPNGETGATVTFKMPVTEAGYVKITSKAAASVTLGINGGRENDSWPTGNKKKYKVGETFNLDLSDLKAMAKPATGKVFDGFEITDADGTRKISSDATSTSVRFTNGGTIKYLWKDRVYKNNTITNADTGETYTTMWHALFPLRDGDVRNLIVTGDAEWGETEYYILDASATVTVSGGGTIHGDSSRTFNLRSNGSVHFSDVTFDGSALSFANGEVILEDVAVNTYDGSGVALTDCTGYAKNLTVNIEQPGYNSFVAYGNSEFYLYDSEFSSAVKFTYDKYAGTKTIGGMDNCTINAGGFCVNSPSSGCATFDEWNPEGCLIEFFSNNTVEGETVICGNGEILIENCTVTNGRVQIYNVLGLKNCYVQETDKDDDALRQVAHYNSPTNGKMFMEDCKFVGQVYAQHFVSIKNCEIESEPGENALITYKAKEIDNVKITDGDLFCSFDTTAKHVIETINDVTIENGRLIFNVNAAIRGKIESISNLNIRDYADNQAALSLWDLDVDSIENVNIIASGTDSPAFSNASRVEKIKNVTAIGESYGLVNWDYIGEIEGGTFSGRVASIIHGSYYYSVPTIGKNNVGPIINGPVQSIDPAGLGYVESDLEDDHPLQGRGRYSDDSIFDYATAMPLYKKGTDKQQTYFFSTRTETVPGFGDTAFHYLTVNVDIKYDKNAEMAEGDASAIRYQGEWNPELQAVENVFTNGVMIFDGWNTQADGKGTSYKPGEVIDIVDDDMTLYAMWRAPMRIITLDLNGGTLDNQTGKITKNIEHGTIFVLPLPAREGYEFDYWEGSRYEAGAEYKVEGDHTFKAIWRLPETTDTGDTPSEDKDKASSETSSGNTSKSNSSKSPGTGDDSNIALWLMIIGMAYGGYILVKNKKKA